MHPANQYDSDTPKVNAAAQLDVYVDDLRNRFVATVNRKDRPQNDILSISTGLPDQLGYVMTGDRFVFQYLHDLLEEGLSLNPVHLDQVILHHWGSGNATLLYQRPGAPGLVDNSAWTRVN